MWTIVLVCGPFCVEQAQKVIGASKLTPWLHGGCIKIEKHVQSSHTRFGDGFGAKAVTTFEWGAVYHRIEGRIMSECDRRKIILNILVFLGFAFGEAAVEVLHEALNDRVGTGVVPVGANLRGI